MKKILACVLAMALALGMVPVALGAYNPGVTAEIKKSGNTITVTVKLPAVTKLTACVVSVEFDPDVVSIPDDEAGYAATRTVEGEPDPVPYFSGEHTGGIPEGVDNIVKNAYANGGSVTKTEVTPFAVFTFTVTDPAAEEAGFIVNLEQFYAEGTTIADGEGMPVLTKTVAIADDSGDDGDGADEAAELAQKIKDFLKQFGLGFLLEDETINKMIEQFADLFGGGFSVDDVMEIINSIIDGDFGGFTIDEIIEFFTDLINRIMELINPTTAAPPTPSSNNTTDTETETEETTSGDPEDGDHTPGDAGIALAVTVCLAAAAAFVLARKKED